MKTLIKSFLVYGLASSIGKFIGLFLVPIYTRVFAPEEYGIIDLIQTVTEIIAIFGMLLLESALQRYYYEVKDQKERIKYLSTILCTICFLSLLCVVFITLFSNQISLLLFSNKQYSNIIILASMKIPISNLYVLMTIIIRYMKKPMIFFLFIISQLLTTIGLSIWLVVYLKLGIIGVFYGQLAGFSTALILMFLYLHKNFILYWNKNILMKLLAFSLPQLPARIGVIGNTYASRFIILGYLSLTDLGIYTIALKIASLFMLLKQALANAWYPFFYECLKNDDHKQTFRKISNYVTVSICVITSLFALFSKDLLLLLTTDKYFGAAPLIGILAFSHALKIICITINLGTLITKKTIYGTYSYLLSVIVNLISLFVLVPKIGLLGVPISLLLGNVVFVILSWYISEKLYYIGFNKHFFIISTILTFLVVSANFLFEITLYYKILFSLSILLVTFICFRHTIRKVSAYFIYKADSLR